MRRRVDLRTFVGSVPLPTPVLTASGTAGHGAELASYFDLSTLGAVVVKSLSAHPWPGNRPPRVHETPAGMLNSVGLQGPGVAAWVAHELPLLNDRGARVVASIWGRSAQEYAQAASMLAGAPGVIAVEVNVSCPNIEDRDRIFAHSAHATAQAVSASAACGLPLWVKLSPNTPDIVDIAGAALEAGAETLVLVNTVLGMAIDPRSRTYRLGSGAGGGGLSGPAIRPVAVRAVHDCRAAFPRVGIVGVGGVSRGVDVVEMMVAGADAVEVGTATFRDPRAPARVLSGLRRWCQIHDVADVRSLVGAVHGTSGAPTSTAPSVPAPSVPAPAAAPVAPTAPSAPSVSPPASEAPVFASPFTAQPDPQSVPRPASAPVVPPVRPRPGVVARPDAPSRVPPLPPRRRPGTGDDHD
jgi:dihydroorotate dehydrogenase (NAD+) catalytic subunit